MTNQKVKILILAAIPRGLRLDKEIREIEDAIRRANERDLFDIRTRTAIRPQDIRRAIAEEKPQIVHFCGHGEDDGSLLLEDDGGNNKSVPPQGLAALFEQHSDYVNCVLFNACYSVKTADAISQHINYVVGMNQAIGDKAAIVFSQGFYDGLGYEQEDNQNVFQKAFNEGLIAIGLEDFSQKSIPVLKKKVVNELKTIKPSNTAIKKLEDISTNGSEASEVGADYTELASMLLKKDFKSADKETTRIMLWVARREKQGWLSPEDINKFPCLDLLTIDQLWLTSSNGKFGFSVQKQIWIECGGELGKKLGESEVQTMIKFSERVEWKVGDEYVSGDNLFWDLRATDGHLPLACVGWYGFIYREAAPELLRLSEDMLFFYDKSYKRSMLGWMFGDRREKAKERVKKAEELREVVSRAEKERGLHLGLNFALDSTSSSIVVDGLDALELNEVRLGLLFSRTATCKL